MITQENLFDYQKAMQNQAEGVARAEGNANPQWMEAVSRIISSFASTGVRFTSDHVWAELARLDRFATPEPRAMGSAILKASKQGVIRQTGEYWRSERPESHGRRIAVWIGSQVGT